MNMDLIKEVSTKELKDILFFDGFIKYTNELYHKTGKKISSVGNFNKAYNAYKIKDFNHQRTYGGLNEYPSAKTAMLYVISYC